MPAWPPWARRPCPPPVGRAPVSDSGPSTDPWRLDPARFPRRLDLELSDEVYDQLQSMSERTGRSISELVGEILEQSTDGGSS
jgi:hypothetical protein